MWRVVPTRKIRLRREPCFSWTAIAFAGRFCLVSLDRPCKTQRSFLDPVFASVIKPPVLLRYQRSKITPRAVLFDANLDLHSIDQLRRWRRDGVPFTVIDTETDEDITQILLA